MQTLVVLFEAAMLAWFALLAMIVAGRILHGDIDPAGLLCHAPGDDEVAPERALSVSLFPVVIISYAYTALTADVAATHSLPPISENLVTLLTGSNALYLAGKFTRSS
ncbi:MAG TPA: hypothetical protein VN655_07520 [Pseudolabrys sp.]|jgi:hypothetical protein|nr:hypothetical protein [Pseudolabrys sp.]